MKRQRDWEVELLGSRLGRVRVHERQGEFWWWGWWWSLGRGWEWWSWWEGVWWAVVEGAHGQWWWERRVWDAGWWWSMAEEVHVEAHMYAEEGAEEEDAIEPRAATDTEEDSDI